MRSFAAASPHWAATAVGEQVLADGGSAVDACVAINAMLGVVYPHMCGIGGDLFALCFEAATGRVHCLNASGRAAALATRDAFEERGLRLVPERGPLSAITVPGAVRGWEQALSRFGTRSLSELLQPAIHAAESGVAVTAKVAAWIEATRDELAADPTLAQWFLTPSGAHVNAGAIVTMPELAGTLRTLAAAGAEDFYAGGIATEIDRAMRDAGGLLRRADFKRHTSNWVDPLHVHYRGVDVYTTPPNSQGIAALEMLKMLEALGADQHAPGSAEHIDLLVRAKHAAFADRDRYVSDPDFVDIPTLNLLSSRHAQTVLTQQPAAQAPHPVGGDTTYFCAVDAHGNTCSAIQSVYFAFGSAFVPGNSGIVLQNRGHYFSLDASHPNRLEPHKRTLHTLMASMALRAGRPWLVFGTMGADGQPQTTVQVLERILAGEDPQGAVSQPRVLSGRFFVTEDADYLHVEQDLGPDVIGRLRTLGHNVHLVPVRDDRMGHAHALLIDEHGGVTAGTDPRSDGLGGAAATELTATNASKPPPQPL